MLNSVLVQKDRGTQVPQMPSESELTGFDIRHAYDINTDSWVIQAIIPLGGTGFTREKETLELVKKDVRAAIEKRLKDEPRRET